MSRIYHLLELKRGNVLDYNLDRLHEFHPDGAEAQQDFIETLRRETEDVNSFRAIDDRAPAEDPREGDVAEDAFYFENAVATCKHYQRKATTRKSKKILSMNGALDGDDWQNKQVLTGRMFLPRRPPFGKIWVKQLFMPIHAPAGPCFDVRRGWHARWNSLVMVYRWLGSVHLQGPRLDEQ